MIITNQEILEAERILLPTNCHFDKERIDFIKNLDSCDLLAVPGSGKTTVLLAKLFCMSKMLPFEDGSGILVLSHTNTAVNEIKKNLESVCPQLFKYPNMVGTVQEFVDHFMAIPFYEQYFQDHIESISSDEYNTAVHNYISSHKKKGPVGYFIHNDVENKIAKGVRFSYDINGKKILQNKIGGHPYQFKAPNKWINEGIAENNLAKINGFLLGMKEHIIGQGILHYDDCYFLADAYIRKHPTIINILQKRFKFVFIDETQDLQLYQLDLLDRLFNFPTTVLQRIGDPNQSIYSKVAKDCLWNIRNPRYLQKSLRLSRPIAEVVNYFALDSTPKFNVFSETDKGIPPYLILYDEHTVSGLRSRFAELIKYHNLQDTKEGNKYGFHIIGWNARAKGEGISKCHLEDIFPNYHHNKNTEGHKTQTLFEYLKVAQSQSSSKEQYKTLIESICKYFQLSSSNYISQTSILTNINKDKEQYNRFRHIIYNVIKHLQLNISYSYKLMINYLKSFEIQSNENAIKFLNLIDDSSPQPESINKNNDDIDIKIGTVHSVKGMTHCATMYIETYYESKFESKHITKNGHCAFYKERYAINGVYPKEAMKMLYVGLSRPTHLLCYATQKHIWNIESLQRLSDCGWEIIDLTAVR